MLDDLWRWALTDGAGRHDSDRLSDQRSVLGGISDKNICHAISLNQSPVAMLLQKERERRIRMIEDKVNTVLCQDVSPPGLERRDFYVIAPRFRAVHVDAAIDKYSILRPRRVNHVIAKLLGSGSSICPRTYGSFAGRAFTAKCLARQSRAKTEKPVRFSVIPAEAGIHPSPSRW